VILTALLYTIHVLVCIFLIFVVLLQQGKGADLSVFGGGTTQTAFGARSATTLLHKLTVGSFIIFTLTTLAIGIRKAGPGGASVMSEAIEQPATPSPIAPAPAAPAPRTPGQQTAPVPAAPVPAPAAPADGSAPPPQQQ
jgi:preprotein translocase subunit SecG